MTRNKLPLLPALIALCLVLPVRAGAEVVDTGPDGFTSRNVVTVSSSPDRIWQALTAEFGQWWDSAHSFFGDAGKFTLDPAEPRPRLGRTV